MSARSTPNASSGSLLNPEITSTYSPIPNAVGGLGDLRTFYAYNNQLSGEIPDGLTSLTSLRLFSVFNNQLVGGLPDNIGNLVNLNYLHVGNNALDEPLPSSIGSLRNLEYFYIQDNDIPGPIPDTIDGLVNVRYWYAYNNDLTGAIPDEIGGMTHLVYLHMSGNQLSGSIPDEIGNIPDLNHLYLYSNELTGNLPGTIGIMDRLETLHLYDNNLESGLPNALGQLTALRYVHLGYNDLTGGIPSSIGSLTNLTQLYLHSNNMEGEVPASVVNLASLTNMLLRDNYCFTATPTVETFVVGYDTQWASGCAPDLAVSVSILDVPSYLSDVDWVISVQNLGGIEEPGAISVTLPLDQFLDTPIVSSGPWTCSVTGLIAICDYSGGLFPRQSAPQFAIRTRVTGITGDEVQLTGVVSGTAVDNRPENNTFTATAIVVSGLVASGAESKPTLAAGIVLVALGLLLVFLSKPRRARRGEFEGHYAKSPPEIRTTAANAELT